MSLRGVSRLLADPNFATTPDDPGLSPSSLRRCVMRLGLARLRTARPPADDWVWMMDHTVQAGPHHVFAVVGLRASQWSVGRAVGLADLELLALEAQLKPTASAVLRVLEGVARQMGPPRVLLSDHGQQLRLAARKWTVRHPDTIAVYDLLHWTGNWLRRELGKDSARGAFQQQIAWSRAKLLQTAAAAWKPPRLRTQARYLNLGQVWGWARRVLDQPEAHRPEALRWLEECRPALLRWLARHEILGEVLAHVRVAGLSAWTAERCLTKLSVTARESEAAVAAQQFLKGQTARMAAADRWPGTTEVLESAFGRWKEAEGVQQQEGFTGWLLSLGAFLEPWTQEQLTEALKQVPYKQVQSWVGKNLGTTVAATRSRLFQRSQKQQEPNPVSTPTL